MKEAAKDDMVVVNPLALQTVGQVITARGNIRRKYLEHVEKTSVKELTERERKALEALYKQEGVNPTLKELQAMPMNRRERRYMVARSSNALVRYVRRRAFGQWRRRPFTAPGPTAAELAYREAE